MHRVLPVLILLFASRGSLAADSVEFRRDVIAALSRAGCNSGACHGSPQGKNGFRLSLRGGAPTTVSSCSRDRAGWRTKVER